MPEQIHIRKRFIAHLLFLTLGWALVLFGHYWLVPNANPRYWVAIFDPAVHGTIALLLIVPFYWWKRIDFKYLAVAVFLAVLIDVDHAIAARSIRVEDMLSLPTRPIGHSVLFCAIISVSAATILKYFFKSKKSFRLLIYLFFIALFSHITRDAIHTDLTPWAYPFRLPPFSDLVFFTAFFVLNLAHLYYAFAKNNLPYWSWEESV